MSLDETSIFCSSVLEARGFIQLCCVHLGPLWAILSPLCMHKTRALSALFNFVQPEKTTEDGCLEKTEIPRIFERLYWFKEQNLILYVKRRDGYVLIWACFVASVPLSMDQ